MTDMEKLLKDYSSDMYVIANMMEKWCEPTKELITRIKKLKRKATKLGKKERNGKR